MLEEQLQERVLGARELDRALAAPHLVRARVEHEVGEAQVGRARLLAPPQQRAQPRPQLAQRERLDEVVVGAGVEPVDAVVDRVARGQHQHRRAVAGRAQPAADLEPVEPRHRDVEHDRVDRRRRERRAPGGRPRRARPSSLSSVRALFSDGELRALSSTTRTRIADCQDTSDAVRVGEEGPPTFSRAADAEYRLRSAVQPALRVTMTITVDIPRDQPRRPTRAAPSMRLRKYADD